MTTLNDLLGWDTMSALVALQHELVGCDAQIVRLCLSRFSRPLTPEEIERNRQHTEWILMHPELAEDQNDE